MLAWWPMEQGGGRSDPRPLTREEEAVKRNTDCVYFLASPLTCKKGSECEYRHSEGARINPRDCKFWFSGNCLNQKCLFRHPPLDGPVGHPVATSRAGMTPSQANASMQLPMGNSTAYNLSRNNVPCYYFQKGTCLKGDKCPFMHGPQPANNSVPKQTAKVSAPVITQLETTKKDTWKLDESSNQQQLSSSTLSLCKESAGKPVYGASSVVEGSLALENANVHLVHKSSSNSFSQPLSSNVQTDRHHSIEREAGEILGEFSGFGYTKLKRPPLNQQLQSSRYKNDIGVEEVFKEFSPGFDVLVNNVVKVADHPHDRDGFRSKTIQGGRNMNHGDGHGHGHHQFDPESTAWLDRDQHNGAGEFQHFGKVHNGLDGDQPRTFSVSERISDKSILPVRRSAHRLRTPDGVDETDLRHRLTKQRRLNSSLSATNSHPESKPYSRHELNMQDRHTHNPYRDQRSTISSRLRGRIALSKPLSPDFPSDFQGGGRGRQRGNSSPARTLSLQQRLGERLSGRPMEDSSGSARNIGNQQKSSNVVDPLHFAGPRSLAELKGAKADASSRTGSTKNTHSFSSMEHNKVKSEVSVAFDGPKPLSTLLNRNGEGGLENDAISGVSNDGKAAQDAVETSLEDTKFVMNNPAEPEVETVGEEEGEIEEAAAAYNPAEDEIEARDAAEDEELDYTDQRDGEYDYETVDGGDYKTEDDENIDPMNIDDDDDDDDEEEDDFAKKIGLIFS